MLGFVAVPVLSRLHQEAPQRPAPFCLGLVYLAFAIGIPTILVYFLLDHKQGMIESGGRHVDVKEARVSSGGGPDAA